MMKILKQKKIMIKNFRALARHRDLKFLPKFIIHTPEILLQKKFMDTKPTKSARLKRNASIYHSFKINHLNHHNTITKKGGLDFFLIHKKGLDTLDFLPLKK